MSERNQNVNRLLMQYVEMLSQPTYAVLLNGAWGCGKTTFIRNLFQQQIQAKKAIYVSLYGMKSISEINSALFQELHPFLGSKTVGFLTKAVGGFCRISIDVEEIAGEDFRVNAGFNVNPDNLDDGTNKKENVEFLILDDVERTDISLNSLFGFVNELIQSKGCKVILIADETQLDQSYLDHKQKVVGRTLTLEPSYEAVLAPFYKEHQKRDQSFCKLIESNKNQINELNRLSKNENLRYIHAAIEDFENIFNQLPLVVKNNSDFLKRLFFAYFVVRIEFFLSKKIDSQFDLFLKETFSDLYSDLNVRKGKYSTFNFGSVPCTKSMMKDLYKGICPVEELEKRLRVESQTQGLQDWEELWSYLNLAQERFDALVSIVNKKLLEGGYTKVEEILHLAGIFLELKSKGLIEDTYSIEDVIQRAVDGLFVTDYQAFLSFDVTDDFGLKYQYRSLETKEFQKIKKYIASKKFKASTKKNCQLFDSAKRYFDYLLDCYKTNKSLFCEDIDFNGQVVSFLNVDDTVNQLRQLKFDDACIVIKQLNSLRHLHSNHFEFEERRWMIDLYGKLKSQSENQANDSLDRLRLESFSRQLKTKPLEGEEDN